MDDKVGLDARWMMLPLERAMLPTPPPRPGRTYVLSSPTPYRADTIAIGDGLDSLDAVFDEIEGLSGGVTRSAGGIVGEVADDDVEDEGKAKEEVKDSARVIARKARKTRRRAAKAIGGTAPINPSVPYAREHEILRQLSTSLAAVNEAIKTISDPPFSDPAMFAHMLPTLASGIAFTNAIAGPSTPLPEPQRRSQRTAADRPTYSSDILNDTQPIIPSPRKKRKVLIKGTPKWDSDDERENQDWNRDTPKVTLVQERLRADTWKMLVMIALLNVTTGKKAIPVFDEVMERWPAVEAMAAADEHDLRCHIEILGLGKVRSTRLILLSKQYILSPFYGKSEIPGGFTIGSRVGGEAMGKSLGHEEEGERKVDQDRKAVGQDGAENASPYVSRTVGNAKSPTPPKTASSPTHSFPPFPIVYLGDPPILQLGSPNSNGNSFIPTSVLGFAGCGEYAVHSFAMFSVLLEGGGAVEGVEDWLSGKRDTERDEWEATGNEDEGRYAEGSLITSRRRDGHDVWRSLRPNDKELIRYMKWRWGIEGIEYSSKDGPRVIKPYDRARLGLSAADAVARAVQAGEGDMRPANTDKPAIRPTSARKLRAEREVSLGSTAFLEDMDHS